MECSSSLLAMLLAGVAEHVQGDAGDDVLLGANAVDGFLHFAMATVAALDSIRCRRQQSIIEEGQGFFQVGGKELVQDAPDFLEAADTLTELGQFGQGGVGAAAAVKQAVDLIHDRAQGAEMRLPSADALQCSLFAVSEVMPHEKVAMIEQVADLFLQTLPLASGPLGGPRARSAARQNGFLSCQLFADLGDRSEERRV